MTSHAVNIQQAIPASRKYPGKAMVTSILIIQYLTNLCKCEFPKPMPKLHGFLKWFCIVLNSEKSFRLFFGRKGYMIQGKQKNDRQKGKYGGSFLYHGSFLSNYQKHTENRGHSDQSGWADCGSLPQPDAYGGCPQIRGKQGGLDRETPAKISTPGGQKINRTGD